MRPHPRTTALDDDWPCSLNPLNLLNLWSVSGLRLCCCLSAAMSDCHVILLSARLWRCLNGSKTALSIQRRPILYLIATIETENSSSWPLFNECGPAHVTGRVAFRQKRKKPTEGTAIPASWLGTIQRTVDRGQWILYYYCVCLSVFSYGCSRHSRAQ